MMDIKNKTKNKRDILLLSILIVLVGGIYLFFQLFVFNMDSSKAHIFYGSSSEPIVTIDFENRIVTKNYTQDVPSEYDSIYPIIDLDKKEITLLGFYSINGVRQILIVKYDFDQKSVEIIEEQSPYNICSKEGVSTGKPIVCLPNRIRIEFESKSDDDFIV
jgi:hypothetical protein